MWPNRIEPNKRSEFCGLSKPGKPCEPTSSNYQVNIINQAPMFTFSSFVSSPVFSWKHHLPLEDAHRTLHISLLSIMTNRKSITGTKPSKYKQMPEKYRKKRVEEYKQMPEKYRKKRVANISSLQISVWSWIKFEKNPNNLQMWVGEGGLSVTSSTISPFKSVKSNYCPRFTDCQVWLFWINCVKIVWVTITFTFFFEPVYAWHNRVPACLNIVKNCSFPSIKGHF